MNIIAGLASTAAAGALLLLGGCAITDNDTHRHGPRGQPMQDSAMPAASEECPTESRSHDMHRPHDTGPMPNAAHPGCGEDQAEAEPAPAQPQAQPQ